MTTERTTWISTLTVSVDEHRTLATTCRCGQDLDVCHGTSCPRCGSTVAPSGSAGLVAAAPAAAVWRR